MTSKESKEECAMIRKFCKNLIKSKKKTKEFLVKHGFITKSGNLTKRYKS